MINQELTLIQSKLGVGEIEHHLFMYELANIKPEFNKPFTRLGRNYDIMYHSCQLLTVPTMREDFVYYIKDNFSEESAEEQEHRLVEYMTDRSTNSGHMIYDKAGVNMRARWFV